MLLSQNTINSCESNYADNFNAFIGPNGTLEFFDGTIPAATTDPDDGNLIVGCLLDPVTAGFATGTTTFQFNPISQGTAVAAGTVTYWRIKTTGGTVIMQGTAGTAGADINLNDDDFSISDTLDITSLEIELATTFP